MENPSPDMEIFLALGHVFWQIARMTLFISLGLFVANMIEALNWSHRLAALARPLIRIGHLSTATGASFSLAFFSGVSSNTMLSEAYERGEMSHLELVLANLLNSLPRFFLHLPTVFFLTVPFIHMGALIYVGLTFSVAIIQTIIVVLAGRLLLPPCDTEISTVDRSKRTTFKEALIKSGKRLKKKIFHVFLVMAPIYLIFFALGQFGFFQSLNDFLANNVWFLSWLKPEALGIVVLHITTEFSAGLAAASALLADNSLSVKEVVLALLVGNILAAPIRAVRHQFPYYTGIYSPKLALELVSITQLTRAGCIVLITLFYFFFG